MKKFFLLFSLVALTASCSQYQKVLKSKDTALKYRTAEELYDEGKSGEGNSGRKFRRALRIYEQIVPEYRGTPQGQRVMFLYADTYYELGDYRLSGYQFERFSEVYPESEKAEEAAYKSAKSYYFLSPPYSLDQTDTYKAINKLQAFINKYPESQYMDEANTLVQDLRIKLEKKAYEIAKQYHKTLDYRAAIAAFENFITKYPGSPFREAALYYKFDAAYEYAINSYAYAMPERLAAAKEYFEDYKRSYPEGEFIEEAEVALQDIEQTLQNLNTTAAR